MYRLQGLGSSQECSRKELLHSTTLTDIIHQIDPTADQLEVQWEPELLEAMINVWRHAQPKATNGKEQQISLSLWEAAWIQHVVQQQPVWFPKMLLAALQYEMPRIHHLCMLVMLRAYREDRQAFYQLSLLST